ncbi:putative Elongator complex protein 4 protein [Trachipleistophora hominis]|uniref:Putative Elongator complex protein 4 protein n=1 Tax=Trachipleistophora hominis TaxID=72359 RepID=L7JV33_TRAHO|nr:putative Elongator complex protein 4 protein [Trachipleistophora hominis]
MRRPLGIGSTYKTNYLGIPLLDNTLSIEPGTSILIEHDPDTNNHHIFEKLFVAQSIADGKKVTVRSFPFCIPATVSRTEEQKYRPMEIAWRYAQRSRPETTEFDFLESCTNMQNVKFGDTIEIAERTCISGLCAPHDNLGCKELFEIKKKVICEHSVLLATCPTYICDVNVGLYFDIVLSLESNYAKENGYHGLLRIKKFTRKPDNLLYGYNISRYGVIMEQFSLAPDDEAPRLGCDVVF